MAKLSKKQSREIVGYLEAGQDIPDDYKHVLFPPERREYELVYADKEREEDIIANTWGVPLQAVKTFNLPKKGPQPDWTNRLIFGDNLQVMKRLLDDPEVKGKVKLVYIDPPFATKQDFQGSQDQKAYQDKIAGAEFIEFLRRRLLFIREILAQDGTVFLHLDNRRMHYMKVIMDDIFGESFFQNEIVWKRATAHNMPTRAYVRVHDTILFYSRGPEFQFMDQFESYSEAQLSRYKRDETGRLYKGENLTFSTPNPKRRDLWRGSQPPINRSWGASLEQREKWWHEGRILKKRDGSPRLDGLKIYLDETKGGVPYSTVWTDVPRIGNTSKERTGYPTQKPEVLLERVLKGCTNEDDLVLDAFAGAGTTLAVAEKLKRRWIGIDCGKLAIYTMQKRLMNMREEIGQKGKALGAKPFTLYNAGLYDFHRMRELPWEDYRLFALQLFQVRDKKHTLGGIALDGFKNDADVLVFNFKEHEDIVVDEEYVEEIHRYIGKRTRDEFYIIAPASRVTFLEDYIDHGNTRYFILRIPYSIIDELHDRPFEQIRQPVDESEINNTVEAVGFDFIIPPTVKALYGVQKRKGEFLNAATITIKKFTSEAMTKKPRHFENRETLSMVMVDYDYRGNGEGIFDLDAAFYRDAIEEDGWKVRLDATLFGEKIMIIYMDIFGNEMREVKTPVDFGIKVEGVRERTVPYVTGRRTAKKPKKKAAKKTTAKKKTVKAPRKAAKKTTRRGK